MELHDKINKREEASLWDNKYNLKLRKREDEITGRNKNKNYVMLILHQFKLMKSNGFAYYLFSLKMITKDIAQTWESLHEPPVGFGNNEWIDMKTKEEESWTNHRKKWRRLKKSDQITGENLENERRYLREFRYKRIKRSWTD